MRDSDAMTPSIDTPQRSAGAGPEAAVTRPRDPLQPPAPSLVARLAPPGLNPVAVAQAAASVEATVRRERSAKAP